MAYLNCANQCFVIQSDYRINGAAPMTYRTRTAAITGTGRTSLRMTTNEWNSIDRLADKAGLRWHDWARKSVSEAPNLPKVEAIRKAIRDELSAEKLDKLEPTDEAYDHDFVNQSRFVDDNDLEAIKNDFREIWAVDCGVFIVRYGFNKLAEADNDPLMIIENRLKDGIHMAFAASHRET